MSKVMATMVGKAVAIEGKNYGSRRAWVRAQRKAAGKMTAAKLARVRAEEAAKAAEKGPSMEVRSSLADLSGTLRAGLGVKVVEGAEKVPGAIPDLADPKGLIDIGGPGFSGTGTVDRDGALADYGDYHTIGGAPILAAFNFSDPAEAQTVGGGGSLPILTQEDVKAAFDKINTAVKKPVTGTEGL